MPIVAIVPPCAGECRLIRVTGVLIFANSRTCVACVLPAAGLLGHRADARLLTGGPAQGLEDEPPRLPIGQSAVRLLLAPLPERRYVTNRVSAQRLKPRILPADSAR